METLLDDRMSAADLHKITHELIAEMGQGDVFIDVSRHDLGKSAGVAIYPNGIASSNRNTKHLRAATWPDAIAEARQWIASQKIVLRNSTIRRMALALISLKDEHGVCRRVDLLRQFSVADVAAYQDAACARANEMAAGSPFVVLP